MAKTIESDYQMIKRMIRLDKKSIKHCEERMAEISAKMVGELSQEDKDYYEEEFKAYEEILAADTVSLAYWQKELLEYE
jgi:hypothetical protein